MAVAHPHGFTLISLLPCRPLVLGQRHGALDADLVRTNHDSTRFCTHRIDGAGKPLTVALHTLLAGSFGLAG